MKKNDSEVKPSWSRQYVQVKYLVKIAERTLIEHAEEDLLKNYGLKKHISLHKQLTREHINHIEEMMNSEGDPNHWSLVGYQNVIDVWEFYQM